MQHNTTHESSWTWITDMIRNNPHSKVECLGMRATQCGGTWIKDYNKGNVICNNHYNKVECLGMRGAQHSQILGMQPTWHKTWFTTTITALADTHAGCRHAGCVWVVSGTCQTEFLHVLSQIAAHTQQQASMGHWMACTHVLMSGQSDKTDQQQQQLLLLLLLSESTSQRHIARSWKPTYCNSWDKLHIAETSSDQLAKRTMTALRDKSTSFVEKSHKSQLRQIAHYSECMRLGSLPKYHQ